MLMPSMERQLNRGLFAMVFLLTFLGIVLAGGSKKVRWGTRRILWGFLFAVVSLAVACGGGGSVGVKIQQTPLNYMVTVTGNANSGAIQHTTQIAVNVP
jgi:hypothetical protein